MKKREEKEEERGWMYCTGSGCCRKAVRQQREPVVLLQKLATSIALVGMT
jgi:hypothetical protein